MGASPGPGSGALGSIASYMNNGMAAGPWFGVPSSGASGGGAVGSVGGPLNLTPGQAPTFISGPGMPAVSANMPAFQQGLSGVENFVSQMYGGMPLPFGGTMPGGRKA